MEIWKPLMRPIVIMDSHNSSSDNYTSERPDYDYYSQKNGAMKIQIILKRTFQKLQR
jgi:hypothetical protein